MRRDQADGLLLTEQLGPVRLLTVNRPDKLNAFTPALVGELHDALDAALTDEATRVLMITGAGPKAFIAGNDIDGLLTLGQVDAYRDMTAGQQLMLRLHDYRKPTLAMVNGYALGGGFELALACDFIVAADTARFGFPEITLNTMPGWGGTQLAVKKMGLSRAKQMVLTGHHYTIDECRDFGFIHEIAPAAQLQQRAVAFAQRLAANSPFSVEMAKRALNRAGELSLSAGMELEAAHYAVNFGTAQARDGLNAFASRRKSRSAGTHDASSSTQLTS